jgi:hypothetical protein
VHIVAHSFGGALTRTLLQELNGDGVDYTPYVASVTTLGTPHSGIFDRYETAHYCLFPKGQDSMMHELSGQLSTHQMGEANLLSSSLNPIFEVTFEKGEIAAALANTAESIPPGIPIQVGIGLTTDRDDPFIIDEGDKVISYEGQRFHPDLTVYGRKPLLKNSTDFGGRVTEFILGGGDRDVGPGYGFLNSFPVEGYSHIGNFSEAKVTCSDNETCQHASYIAVREWLETYGQGDNVPKIEKHYMTLGPLSGCENPPPVPKDVFEIGNSIVAYNFIHNIKEKDTSHMIWHAPDDTFFKIENRPASSDGSACCYTGGNPHATQVPGIWLVDFYYNDIWQYTDGFLLQ